MARIPINPERSSVIAQPVQAQNLPAGAFGGGVAAAVGNLADNVNVMAQRSIGEQQRQAKEVERQRQHEADTIAKAAQQAKRLTVTGAAEDGLADLHDQIAEGVRDGSVPRDKAEQTYREKATKIIEQAGIDMPDTPDRPVVLAQIGRNAERLTNGVRRAVTDRDRHEVTAGLNSTLEYAQRMYRTDPAKANAIAAGAIEALGPHSNLPPEQVAGKFQAWKESTQADAARRLVDGALGNPKALADAEKLINNALPDINPAMQTQQLDRIRAERLHIEQKADIAAARAAREAERHLKHAEASFNAFQALADKGGALDSTYIENALKDTAGTPYAKAITGLAAQAKETGGLAAQPVRMQQAMLDQINATIAKEGRSPGLDKRKEQMEKVLAGSRHDIERDPLRAGLERGLIPELPPLNMGGGVQGLVPQLTARVDAAKTVGQWAGQPVSPFTNDEADVIKRSIEMLPMKERAAALAGVATAVGPEQTMAIGAQLGKGEKDLSAKAAGLTLRYGASGTTENRFVGEIILKGAQAIKDKTIKEEKTPVEGWRGQINTSMQGLYLNQKQAEETADAAHLILAGLVSEGASGTKSDVAQAIRLAVGGQTPDINGARTVVPAGIEPDDVKQRMRRMKPEEVKAQAPAGKVFSAGAALTVDQFLAGLPDAQLQYAGRGRYFVKAGRSGFVSNEQGDPLVIEVSRGTR